jgi:hypothetical protein
LKEDAVLIEIGAPLIARRVAGAAIMVRHPAFAGLNGHENLAALRCGPWVGGQRGQGRKDQQGHRQMFHAGSPGSGARGPMLNSPQS